MRFFLAICLWAALAVAAQAQALGEDRAEDSDRGFLTGLLEDSLGGEGRVVRITGFAGALSSEARMDRITIADADGIWLDMRDLRMAWNRSALLRGRIEIDTLSAGSIVLDRLPAPTPEEAPSPEAGGFALPDLPVSVELRALTADRIALGASVLGRAAEMRLQLSAALISGSAQVELQAERIDGRAGAFTVNAAYDAASTNVEIDLDLSEGAGGLIAETLDLRGQPAMALQVSGQGPVNDLLTEIRLETDGQPRLEGRVGLQGSDVGFVVELDVNGALAPLFPENYAVFFAQDTVLQARALRDPAGALEVERFLLDAGVTRLEGRVALTEDSRPAFIDIAGQLGRQDGAALPLPISDGQTRVASVALDVDFDAASSNALSAMLDLRGLRGPGYQVPQAQVTLDGQVADLTNPQSGFDGLLNLVTDGLVFDDAALQAAVGTSLRGSMQITAQEGAALQISDLALQGADYGLRGSVEVAGLDAEFRTDIDIELIAEELARFAALASADLSGAADLSLRGFVTAGGFADLAIAGRADAVSIGVAQADALLAGETVLDLQVIRDAAGTRLPRLDLRNDQLEVEGQADLATGASAAELSVVLFDTKLLDPALEGPLELEGRATQTQDVWAVTARGAGPFAAQLRIDGPVTGPAPKIIFAAELPDLSPLVPQLTGSAAVQGTLEQSATGWLIETEVQGPYAAVGDLKGRITGNAAPDIAFTVSIPDVAPLAPGVSGPLAAEGRALQTGAGLEIETAFTGPFETAGEVTARVTGQNAPVAQFDVRLRDVAALAPGFRGGARATGALRNTSDGIEIETDLNGPYALEANVAGRITGSAPAVTFRAALPDVAPLGTGVRGPLSVTGSATGQGTADWQVQTEVSGPAGSTARIAGLVGSRFDLTARGTAPLGLAEPFLQPRAVQGTARFDLRLAGAPSLQAVSGVIETDDARFADPSTGITLQTIAARIALSDSTARINATAQVETGGQLTAEGSVGLTGGFNGDLALALNDVRLVDEALYEVGLGGQIRVQGPLTGGALIAGQIDVSEVTVQIPSSTSAGFTIVPTIVHQGAPAPVRRTLERAGLNPRGTASEAGGSGGVYGLDLQINAPARLFVRGRGLDAELGGQLRVSGRTDALISTGGFELVRGRLDLLGKRFTLEEGRLELQGQFDPFIRFVAMTTTADGTASVTLEGLASAPQVRFSSNPERPEDEVLAQIFFGRSASQLSAFQALQLASAVASLSGGGGGVVSNLRAQFDLDDLDVTTDDDGAVGLRLGKYISDNIYTDVLIGDRDDAGVSLNVDLSSSVTMRGTVESSGDSSIGVFFERDY